MIIQINNLEKNKLFEIASWCNERYGDNWHGGVIPELVDEIGLYGKNCWLVYLKMYVMEISSEFNSTTTRIFRIPDEDAIYFKMMWC
jgi:hypothetical protein